MTKHSTPRAQLQPETDLSLPAQLFFFLQGQKSGVESPLLWGEESDEI